MPTEFSGFTLLPANDPGVSSADDLDAAARSLLGERAVAVGDDTPEPFGRTWRFDWDAGRFIRQGGAPVEVSGLDAAGVWCETAAHVPRYAYRIFSDVFGTDEPEGLIGEANPSEGTLDYIEALRRAWLVHDRLEEVEDIEADYDPTQGVLSLGNFTIISDEGDVAEFGDIVISTSSVEA